MATLHAATVSNGAVVTDVQAVEQLCGAHDLGCLDWEISHTNKLYFWGEDSFEVHECSKDGLPQYEDGPVTQKFLQTLATYLAPSAELDIQTVGHTKCRYPVHAERYVVRKDEVRHADLSGAESIDA